MLAINLERAPADIATAEKIRDIFQDLQISSIKLDLIPISESLEDTIKGLDLLLDWQVYPPGMTEFVLQLIDRVLIIAREVEQTRSIDMRKTQAILVALQFIILAKSPAEITQGIEDAIVAINQEIPDDINEANKTEDIVLFDDGVELFDDLPENPKSVTTQNIDIFIPLDALNPLHQAREYIQGHSNENCLILLGQVSDHATQHYDSHTGFLLELSLAMNFLAGEAVDMDSLYKGICLHDIALVSLPQLLTKPGQLSTDEIEKLHLHPVKGANVAHEFLDSEEIDLLILHHHERMDGSGYPAGLKGDNISEQGKLAAIVDSFHSVVEQHPEMSERERILKAIIEININMGKHYDKSWVKLFNTCLRDYWLPAWRAS